MKQVYVGMASDLIHHGHIKIINEAQKHGEVTVGLMTDRALASYKKEPIIPFEHRKTIIENIKGVSRVIAQDNIDSTENIIKLKPDVVVHGDDWKTGPQKKERENVLEALKKWNGKLIEPEYTHGASYSEIVKDLMHIETTPDLRRQKLKKLLGMKNLIRILEAHNGLTGRIIETTKIYNDDGSTREFDGMWESSLTDSTSKGKPDTGAVDYTSRMQTVEQIMDVTTKPMIFDADSGGLPEHFRFLVRSLERQGVSAVIIEDKVGPKRNSLFGTDVEQNQDTIENFSYKISEGKRAKVTDEFMIIARIESLILKKGMDDAIKRAKAYIEAGADGIMIHSKEKEADEILEFCEKFNKFEKKVPLVVVPSTYSHITEKELEDAGVNIVIYANHLLRSAYPAMKNVAEKILKHSRCHEASEECLPIKHILTLIPTGE